MLPVMGRNGMTSVLIIIDFGWASSKTNLTMMPLYLAYPLSNVPIPKFKSLWKGNTKGIESEFPPNAESFHFVPIVNVIDISKQ